MKPALTAEEWEFEMGKRFFEILHANPEWAHKLAAVHLYNQSFGFTREDVIWVKDVAEWLDKDSLNPVACSGGPFYDLAERIEALLPPEDKP